MANSRQNKQDVKRTHYCPKCGERMRKYTDNSGMWVKCPREACGYDYQIYYSTKKAEKEQARQLPLFPTDYTDIPF